MKGKISMKRLENIIIIVFVIIIVLTAITLIMLKNVSKNDIEEKNVSYVVTVDKEIQNVESKSIFFTVEDIINNFYSYIYQKNDIVIYNLLDKEYINREKCLKMT